MGRARAEAGGGGPGGIATAAPELRGAVNAVRLHADWRPILGLTPEDAGTLVERVLADVVIAAAVDAHNRDVAEAKRKT